jgi:hypothetical protein
MRRALFAFSVLGLWLSLSVAVAAEDRVPLRATLAACESGPAPEQRFAVFTASMPALAGTERMWMRFDLMEKRARARRWTRLRAPAFGRWDRSHEAGASGFIYTKRVERLKETARYRAVVRFRWLDGRGRVQRETRRVTRTCTQPSQRPNLRVESLGIAPGADAGTSRYLVTVVNDGRTDAAAFTLGLVAGGREQVRDVPGLATGGRTTVELTGPRCEAGQQVAATLDIRGVVLEADERDNRAMRLCTGR